MVFVSVVGFDIERERNRLLLLSRVTICSVFKITLNPGGSGCSFWCGIEVALGLVRASPARFVIRILWF